MAPQGTTRSYVEAPTRAEPADGRSVGPADAPGGEPRRLGPRIVDGLAQDQRLIAVDKRDSTGRVLGFVYPDSGHGVVFHYREFADAARGLLCR